jgi:hypothetical protein
MTKLIVAFRIFANAPKKDGARLSVAMSQLSVPSALNQKHSAIYTTKCNSNCRFPNYCTLCNLSSSCAGSEVNSGRNWHRLKVSYFHAPQNPDQLLRSPDVIQIAPLNLTTTERIAHKNLTAVMT